jgi:hypothetical protein
LQKSDTNKPGIANRESANFFRMEKDKDTSWKKTAYKCPTDFMLPMSTKMFDLRVSGTNFCEWQEEFIINERV